MADLSQAADLLAAIASGFGVGLLIGLTGVAGAALMTPLLISTFGLSPQLAVGTDLFYAAATKFGAVWRHQLAGHVDWRVVRVIALGSVPASLALLAAIALVPLHTDELASWIRIGLGIVLPLSAGAILLRPRLLATRERHGRADDMSGHDRAAVMLGVVLGFAVTLTSVGAGAIGVPVLAALYPLLSAKRIVGTDIAHSAILASVAGLGHLGLGHVDFAMLGLLLIGSFPGMMLGSKLCDYVPDKVLRPVLAVTLCYAAYTLFND
jgi:uncharacterized membrane protein YfcA